MFIFQRCISTPVHISYWILRSRRRHCYQLVGSKASDDDYDNRWPLNKYTPVTVDWTMGQLHENSNTKINHETEERVLDKCYIPTQHKVVALYSHVAQSIWPVW